MTLKESLNHVPVELAFGTSGLRGLVKDMTDLECFINTQGFLHYLKKHDNLKDDSDILIAGDLRASTPRIMQVVTASIKYAGYQVINCGLVPTPTAALLGFVQQKPCIIITGSHIPADRNGIKYYKKEGEVLKADEEPIKACVSDARTEIYAQNATQTSFNPDGSLKKLPILPQVNSTAEDLYKKRFYDFFEPGCLKGKKIVFYQQSAVGRDLIVEILEALSAEVIPIERSKTFIPLDTENVTETEKKLFKSFAAQYPDAFAIVSTDGDSDRPFVIDETGEFHRGDILGCIVAEYLGAKFAATPISSNDAVDLFSDRQGITMVHTKIGSPYVIVAMGGAKERPAVSWEVNGGFLVGSGVRSNDKTLTPLPTRDATLPIICALAAAIESNQKLSELFNSLPHRYTGGGLIDDIDQAKIRNFFKACEDETKIMAILKTAINDNSLGSIENTNLTDGLRLVFESGDVLHLRPSNNAPQFRVYTNANSQARADELTQEALAPNGYIQALLKLL